MAGTHDAGPDAGSVQVGPPGAAEAPADGAGPRLVTTAAAQEAGWVAGTRAGDELAFDAMFRAYAASLCSFVSGYVKSRAIAEELVQDVFFRIWRQREQWVVQGSLRTYLYVAARHAALNHIRHQRITERAWDRASRAVGQGPTRTTRDDTANLVQSEELASAVRAAVAQLPERCRQVYVLSRQHQLSYAEIAAVLSISPKTVENQVGIALRTLRERLAHLLRPD